VQQSHSTVHIFGKELNMNANAKSSANAKSVAPVTNPAIGFANLFHEGMVRFAEIQKTALDQIARLNADFQNAWKQTDKAPSAQAMAFMDLAGQGIEKIVDAQKSLVDLTVEQSALVLDLSKEGIEEAAKRGGGIAEIVRQSTDKLIAAEKIVLNFAAGQNALVIGRIKRQFGMADGTGATLAADSIRRGMDVVIDTQKEDTQKEMVESAAKPIKAATATAASKSA